MSRQKAVAFDIQSITIEQLHDQVLSEFSGYALRIRTCFSLITEYLGWLKSGRKCTTVRYRPNAIDVPFAKQMSLYETVTNDDANTQNANEHWVSKVEIVGFLVKPFGMLNDRDAQRDGFHSRDELKARIQRLYNPTYPKISENECVSIYTIRIIE